MPRNQGPKNQGPRNQGPKNHGPKNRNKGGGGKKADADTFMHDLIQRMDACPTAESLNDQVIMPFILALEKVFEARGYAMNIYGETANLVFTGSSEDAEAIYQIVEAYLDDQQD